MKFPDRRFNHKAIAIGVADPFSAQVYRYNTGSNYIMSGISAAASMENAKKQQQAAKNALNAEMLMSGAQMQQQQKQYKENKEIFQPYMEAGYGALDELQALGGQKGENAYQAAIAKFRNDPGYKFSVDQANQALERSALSKSNLFSGNYGVELSRVNQGMADQQYSNYYNRLWNIANMGRGTATGVASMNTNYANTMSDIFGNIGNQGANYYYRKGQIFSDMNDKLIAEGKSVAQQSQDDMDNTVNTVSSMYGGGMFGGMGQ